MEITITDQFPEMRGAEGFVPPYAMRVAWKAAERLSFIAQRDDLYPFVRRIRFKFRREQGITLRVKIRTGVFTGSCWKEEREYPQVFDITPDSDSQLIVEWGEGHIRTVIDAMRCLITSHGLPLGTTVQPDP